jgi:N-succinyldiaminopimelate aminotransferase
MTGASSSLSDRCRSVLGGNSHVAEWKKLLEKAEEPGMVNLTQGFPDFPGSLTARQHASEVLLSEAPGSLSQLNQYSPLVGLVPLMDAISNMYKRLWNLEVCPKTEVVVTSSGTEAIMVALQTLLSPGDEVLFFEPFFPWYAPGAQLAGATPKIVRLNMEEGFTIDRQRLLDAFDLVKTKMVIINTPHNPSGKVLSSEEIELIHEVASMSKREGGCIVFSDEAYEGQCWAAQGGHVKIESAMRKLNKEKSTNVEVVTMGSASKLCSLTGWRVGWLFGPEHIISGCKAMHGFTTYCAPSPFQYGISKAIDGYKDHSFDGTGELMQANSAKVAKVLREMGFSVHEPEGGYFVIADCSPLGFTSNIEFCRKLMEECQVAVAPMNMFYGPRELNQNEKCYVRLAICKTEAVIDEAIDRIRTLKPLKK